MQGPDLWSRSYHSCKAKPIEGPKQNLEETRMGLQVFWIPSHLLPHILND